MHRPVPLLLATAALALAACSSGEDDSAAAAADADDATDQTIAAPETTVQTVPPNTEDCEDAPDPADYVDGEVPPAIRPCEIPTELVVHTLREGAGTSAEAGDTLIADYVGIRSEDGTQFDTSYTRGVPLDFPVGRGGVIQGWDDGLVGAKAGSAYKLDIPAELAYGDTPPGGGEGEIQAGDALTFIVEVRAVVPSVTVEESPFEYDIEPSVGALEVTTSDLEVGDGAPVELGTTAVIHMLLFRGDNTSLLFNTWEQDDAIQIVMQEGQTLPGIFEGIQGAQVGTLRYIAIPPADAFGVEGEPILGLPADVDLIALIEVVGVY